MWLRFPQIVAVLSPLPILIACASGGVDPNVITAPELTRSQATSTYDAIRDIRPEMLRARDPGTLVYFKASQPLVAVDNTLVGGVELLRAIPVDQVARIEFVAGYRAAKLYGLGFGNGIMLIETRPDSQRKLADR
jgi:outer membrane cobalamin receptor